MVKAFRSGLLLGFGLLFLLPQGFAQQETVEVTDPANDIRVRSSLGPEAPAPQVYEALDITRAWIGEETLDSFSLGLERTASSSTATASPPGFQTFYNLWIEWEFGTLRYRVDFGDCGENAAALQVLVESQTQWSDLGCIDAEDTAAAVSASVPKILVTDAEGFPVRSGSVFSNWHAGSHEVVSFSSSRAFDDAPDTGVGEEIRMELGDTRFGDLVLSTVSAYRSSNGGVETMVFPIRVDNVGNKQITALVAGVELPSNWAVRVPPRVVIPAASSVVFPAIVTTDFGHDHGTTETFAVQIAPDDGPIGTLDLGINFLDVPQLSGHHSRLYLHAGTGEALTGAETGGQGWFNTLSEDPQDTGNNHAAQGGGQGGTMSYAHWTLPLDPSLLIGMDFDTASTGSFTTAITTHIPSDAAALTAEVWHCLPRNGTGLSIGIPCPSGSWFLLAEGRSATQTVTAGGTTVLEVALQPAAYSDMVPYVKGSNVALNLQLEWAGPPSFFAFEPSIVNGASTLQLPLNEYRDPIDESFQDVGSLRMTPLGPFEKPANAGQDVWFEFLLENTGAGPRVVRLDAAGYGADFVDWLPESSFTLNPDESRRVAFRVMVADDADDGDYFEVFAVAEDESDPLVVAMSQLRVYVTTEPVEQAPRPAILDDEKETPSGGAILALIAVLGLVAYRRFQ